MSAEKCLICGNDIPEGRQVCPICENKAIISKMKRRKKKMLAYIFPIALIVLDMGAAIMYIIERDYRKAVYWTAAAILNISVTF